MSLLSIALKGRTRTALLCAAALLLALLALAAGRDEPTTRVIAGNVTVTAGVQVTVDLVAIAGLPAGSSIDVRGITFENDDDADGIWINTMASHRNAVENGNNMIRVTPGQSKSYGLFQVTRFEAISAAAGDDAVLHFEALAYAP